MRDWPIAAAPKLPYIKCIQKCGKPMIDFPPENDKPRRVRCTAKLQADGIISEICLSRVG
jgi:hypothetical protein